MEDQLLFIVILIVGGVISLVRKAAEEEKKKQKRALEAAQQKQKERPQTTRSPENDRELVACAACGGLNIPGLSECLFCHSPLVRKTKSSHTAHQQQLPIDKRKTVFEQQGTGTRFEQEQSRFDKRKTEVKRPENALRKRIKSQATVGAPIHQQGFTTPAPHLTGEYPETKNELIPVLLTRIQEQEGLMEAILLKELLDKPLALRQH